MVRSVMTLETEGDRIARLRNYFFTPDVIAEVCAELGVPYRINGYGTGRSGSVRSDRASGNGSLYSSTRSSMPRHAPPRCVRRKRERGASVRPPSSRHSFTSSRTEAASSTTHPGSFSSMSSGYQLRGLRQVAHAS